MSENDFDLDAALRSILDGETVAPTMTAPAPQPVATLATPQPEKVDVLTVSALAGLPALSFPQFTTDELTEAMDIRNYATMARLRMRKWHARKKDKRVARDASKAEGASEAAFSVYKRLLAGAEEKLKKVHSIIDGARMRHYELTLPWSTTGVDESGRRDGPRLLPNTLFMEYVGEMGKAKIEAEAALDDFVQAYPSLIEASKRSLGKSFDETEYPPPSQIKDHFALDFDFQPIPTGVDFKGLPAQQIAALKERLDSNTRRALENAMRDVWVRLHEVISHMAERLCDPDRTFHDTLVSNVRETVALARHLNATGDKRVALVVAEAERKLIVHEPETLRNHPATRQLVATHAVEILHEMGDSRKKE